MLLGLEQFLVYGLRRNSQPSLPVDLLSDITDVDAELSSTSRQSSGRDTLMALLSGNRKKTAEGSSASSETKSTDKETETDVDEPAVSGLESLELGSSISDLESRAFASGRTVSAKDFLLRKKPKKSQESLVVSLNIGKGHKQTKMVTLSLKPEALRAIRPYNALVTRGSGNSGGKSAFDMMMSSATSTSKLTPLQKLKELEPPRIARAELHVTTAKRAPSVHLSLESRTPQCWPLEHTLYFDISSETPHALYIYSNCENIDIAARAPLSLTSAPHRRAAFACTDNDSVWPVKFAPQSTAHLLEPTTSRAMFNWMANAFDTLQGVSTKTPRNVLLKKQRKKKARQDFIVDDSTEEELEDVFVPVLVVVGDTGSGKTSAVYAAVTELGGYVHEINTSHQRSKRDIMAPLKEFCTTQIILKNNESSFQRGVVLFEDCDVLFEQDKTFWGVVQEVMNFSKRPIVLTVMDVSTIPRNILDQAVEQNSVITVGYTDRDALGQYLWLCCHLCGHNLSQKTLDHILNECYRPTCFDIRKALMMCQWLCIKATRVSIDYVEETKTKEASFADMTHALNLLSCADVISVNTKSAVLAEHIPNELLDVNILSDYRGLTLDHELNVGNTLLQHAEMQNPRPTLDVRSKITTFLSSRARFTARQGHLRATRSGHLFVDLPEPEHLPATSYLSNLPSHAMNTELAPFCRSWARAQKYIIERDAQDPNSASLEAHLRWRRFENAHDAMKTFFV